MNGKKEKIIYWLPRVLGLVFVLFLSLFSLDVFGEFSGWHLVLALFMHLLPALILLGVIIIAWKYDLAGAAAFLFFAAFYTWQAGFDQPWSWYALISAPAAITGIAFLLSWLQKKKIL
jgi:hypothetical protein